MSEHDPALTEPPAQQKAESVTPFAAPQKSVARFVVLAVALFLTAGAFATLWTIERGDHRTSTGQIGEAQAELRRVQQELTGVTGVNETLRTRIKQELDTVPGLEAETEKDRPCSNVVRELHNAADLQAAQAAVWLIFERCK